MTSVRLDIAVSLSASPTSAYNDPTRILPTLLHTRTHRSRHIRAEPVSLDSCPQCRPLWFPSLPDDRAKCLWMMEAFNRRPSELTAIRRHEYENKKNTHVAIERIFDEIKHLNFYGHQTRSPASIQHQ